MTPKEKTWRPTPSARSVSAAHTKRHGPASRYSTLQPFDTAAMSEFCPAFLFSCWRLEGSLHAPSTPLSPPPPKQQEQLLNKSPPPKQKNPTTTTNNPTRWLLAFKKTNQNTLEARTTRDSCPWLEVKKERLKKKKISTRQNNVRIFGILYNTWSMGLPCRGRPLYPQKLRKSHLISLTYKNS